MAKQAKRGSYLDISGDSLQGFQTITASTSLTIASPKQGYVSSPAAAVTVTLPTTDVKAGFVYKIDVVGATETNFVRLNSSGGNEVDRIGGEGFIKVMALQDSPTTAAHWRIVDVYEYCTTQPTIAGAGLTSFTIQSAITVRRNKLLNFDCAYSVTCNNVVDTFGIAFTYPSRLTPVPIVGSGSNIRLPAGQVNLGVCSVAYDAGTIGITPTIGGGNFRNATSTGHFNLSLCK